MGPPIFQDTPWLGGEHDGYQRVPFEKYLELKRVGRSSEDRSKIFPYSRGLHSSREDLAKLQCLFTFGLLEAVMEVKVAENKLLRLNSRGEQVLTNEYLPDLLLDFHKRFLQLQGDDRARIPVACWEWASRVETTFTQARNILYSETLKGRNNTFLLAGLEPQVLADIIIQMGCIVEAVVVSTGKFREELISLDVKKSVSMFITVLVPDDHRTAMFANGWCPVIVHGISLITPCLLGYARTLKCPLSRSSEGHWACTPESCQVNTRDSSNGAPKHVSESCKCNNYKPSLEDVEGFLQTRRIPVVQYCPPPHDRPLSVRDSF